MKRAVELCIEIFSALLLAFAANLFYTGDLSLNSSLKVFLSDTTLEQGDTLFVKTSLSPRSGKFGGEEIFFFKTKDGNEWGAIVGIDVKKDPGLYDLAITLQDGSSFEEKIDVAKREFPTNNFVMTQELRKKGYTVAKVIDGAVNKENEDLYKIFRIFNPDAYFNDSFEYPLENIKEEYSYGYGNYKKNKDVVLQHLGADIGEDLNTQVRAINNGVVVYAEDLNTYGQTLVLGHGLGAYSLYLHLNEFKANVGDRIKKGDIIGLSGNSGYSVSPHLHFSIKINMASVDPLRFIQAIKKGFVK